MKLYQKLKKVILGSGKEDGIAKRAVVYTLLTGIGFIFLYPILFMVPNSLMEMEDLVNPTVSWIPTKLYFGNFAVAFKVLDASKALWVSVLMSLIPAFFQTAVSAFVGYGFARFDFILKKLWIFMLVVAFVVPAQVTLVPRYMMFDAYSMINTPFPSVLPALLGQGIKGSIFVLIFFQFFRTYPKVLDEAAEIDGAGTFSIFFKIALPMAIPAIVVAFLFSFVWYWNETYQAGIFYGRTIQTLPMKLQSFVASYTKLFPSTDGSTSNRLNESIRMAGTLITIAPLLILYLILQKRFVESVDKTGITGE